MMNKAEINVRSVQAIKQLLFEIIEEPGKFNSEDFFSQLKSQGALAKMEDLERGIVPCVLNTQKNVAERIFDDGFDTLNTLRNNALMALEGFEQANKRSNKTTKTGLQKRVKELENKINSLEQQNFMLIDLVSSLKSSLEHNAKENGNEKMRFNVEHELKSLRAKASFTQNKVLIQKVHDNA